MKASCSSEALVPIYQSTWHHIPGYWNIHHHRCHNLWHDTPLPPLSVAVVILSKGHQGSRNYPRHIQNFITLINEISFFPLRIVSHNVLEVKVHTIPNLRSVHSIAHAMTTQCCSNIQLCILNPHLDEVFYLTTKRGLYLCAAHERHLRVATKTSLSDKLQLTIFLVTLPIIHDFIFSKTRHRTTAFTKSPWNFSSHVKVA